VVDETLAAFRAWERSISQAIETGSVASMHVETASEWAATDRQLPGLTELPATTVEQVGDRDVERPSGAAFGVLVHAVLAAIPLDADATTIRGFASVHGRILAASEGDIDETARLVGRVLSHPLLSRARRSTQCRRELPLTFTEDSGRVIEGVADLAFLEDGGWTVVDFKTDVEIGRLGLDVYRRQVGFYAAAVARASGQPASSVILRI
jgi:ATP-dependent exoDNAse (exonuclease V) beta subunit